MTCPRSRGYRGPLTPLAQVSYTYPVSSLLHKPLTVAGVVLGLFMLGLGLRRVDYSIERKK